MPNDERIALYRMHLFDNLLNMFFDRFCCFDYRHGQMASLGDGRECLLGSQVLSRDELRQWRAVQGGDQ